jgi:hypothetical protein
MAQKLFYRVTRPQITTILEEVTERVEGTGKITVFLRQISIASDPYDQLMAL